MKPIKYLADWAYPFYLTARCDGAIEETGCNRVAGL